MLYRKISIFMIWSDHDSNEFAAVPVLCNVKHVDRVWSKSPWWFQLWSITGDELHQETWPMRRWVGEPCCMSHSAMLSALTWWSLQTDDMPIRGESIWAHICSCRYWYYNRQHLPRVASRYYFQFPYTSVFWPNWLTFPSLPILKIDPSWSFT